MDQLKSKLVNLTLNIEEGRGMDFIKESIVLSANFNGRLLDSDPVEAKDCPLFNTNLIWEIEKKMLRKIRSSNQPLRIDCYVVDETNERRDRIGYLMFDLRSAYIGDVKPVVFRWHKLVGLRCKRKNCRPELFLAVTVTDPIVVQCPSNETCLIDKISDASFGDNNTPQLEYLEDYIKIGGDQTGTGNNNRLFSFNVLIKFASNLDILLPEILVFQENKNKYCMSFKIFDIPIKTKQFYKDLHEKIVFDEKIVVKLLSTIETIRNFFHNQEIEVSFYSGTDKLGVTIIALNELVISSSGNSHLDLECYFKFPSPNGIVPTGSEDRQPFVYLEFSLNQIEDKAIKDEESIKNEEDTLNSISPLLPKSSSLKEDEEVIDNQGLVPEDVDIIATNNDAVSSLSSSVIDTGHQLMPITEAPKNFHQYRLTIEVQNLSMIKTNSIQYKFLHPKAASFINIIEDKTRTKNTHLQTTLIYVTSDEEIKNLISFWPPKLILISTSDDTFSEEHQIKTSSINSSYIADFCKEDKDEEVVLMAKLKIDLKLTKQSNIINDSEDNTKILLPPILDEQIAVLQIEELHAWKSMEKQQLERNLIDLKCKMEDEWEKKKTKLKMEFEKNMEKCKVLQEELQERIYGLKTINNNKPTDNDERELMIIEENELLKKTVDEQKRELAFFQKTAFTKEQTAVLLQELKSLEEKFETAHKYKDYFKSQWQEACEEIDDLKCEDYKLVQDQLDEERAELLDLSFGRVGDNWQQFFIQ